jgi:hypothetical protein
MDFRSFVIFLPLLYINTCVMFVILKHNIVDRPILVVWDQTNSPVQQEWLYKTLAWNWKLNQDFKPNQLFVQYFIDRRWIYFDFVCYHTDHQNTAVVLYNAPFPSVERHAWGNIFFSRCHYVLVYGIIGRISAERLILKDSEEHSPGLIQELFRHLFVTTQETVESLNSGWMVSRSRFEPEALRISIYRIAATPFHLVMLMIRNYHNERCGDT